MHTGIRALQEMTEGILEDPHARKLDESNNPIDLVSRLNVEIDLTLQRQVVIAACEKVTDGES